MIPSPLVDDVGIVRKDGLRMSNTSDWSMLRERVAGKWQFPLLGVAVVVLVAAVLRHRSVPSEFPIDRLVAHLDQLITAGLYEEAMETGMAVLDDRARPVAQLGPVHVRVARALDARVLATRRPSREIARSILDHLWKGNPAQRLSDSSDLERAARAFEWLGDYEKAFEHLAHAMEAGAPNPARIIKRRVELLQRRLAAAPSAVNEELDRLLDAVEEDRLDLRLWGLEQKIKVLRDMGRLDEATLLLPKEAGRFAGTELAGDFRYLEGLVLFHRGEFSAAETHLRTMRENLDPWGETYAKSGWLLGRVILYDGGQERAAEALSFFEEVLKRHEGSPHGVACHAGRGECLALLGRHTDAIEAFQVAIDQLDAVEDDDLLDVTLLRATLGIISETQRQAGDFESSLAYARLATSLVEENDLERATLQWQQLARALTSLGEHLLSVAEEGAAQPRSQPLPQVARGKSLLAEAAEAYLRIAQINAANEQLAGEAYWSAGEWFARSGQLRRAADVFETFARERPNDPLTARALLRVGRMNEMLGRPSTAIRFYQECYRRFPRSLAAARALVPLARCYLSADEPEPELAQSVLRIVLEESPVFTPQAPEFADALFLLGRVHGLRNAHEEAIAAHQEALDRFPNDPRVWEARFHQGQAYRKSALALRAAAETVHSTDHRERLRQEARGRLEQAARLYRGIIREYEARGASRLTRLERLCLHHSLLYEADCYFDAGEYAKALRLYEEATGALAGTPGVLSAYVQIINVHLTLNEPGRAGAALARVKLLVESLEDEALASSVSPLGRQDWQRYFDWLDGTDLF